MNIDPLSFELKIGRSLKIQELRPAWTTRKEIRNKPVKAITIFLPTAEVKNWDHFISYQEGLKKFDAKVSSDYEKLKFIQNENNHVGMEGGFYERKIL